MFIPISPQTSELELLYYYKFHAFSPFLSLSSLPFACGFISFCICLQLAELRDYKTENDDEVEDYNSLYSRAEYMENEDGELSWFNAGVRVGVGIGLGICLGIGIGVGLLVRTYQATNRNFKRRL